MSLTENGTEVQSYIRIHYTSETNADWVKGLTDATNLEALKELATTYRRVADDAFAIIDKMTAKDFQEFRAGLRKERKGQFAGEEWAAKYGNVLMPDILFRVAMIANQYVVPWGCAYIRLKDVGRITEPNRIARWHESAAPTRDKP